MPVQLESHPPERRERPLIVAGGCCSCCCCCSCCVHSLGGAIGGAIGSGRALRPAEAELEACAFDGKDTTLADANVAHRRGAIGVYWLLVAVVTVVGCVGLTLTQDVMWGIGLVILGFPLLQLAASLLSLFYCVWHTERLKALGTVTLWSFVGGILIWLPIVAVFMSPVRL